jgi:N6-adenosine-specific RNA methylase IME4
MITFDGVPRGHFRNLIIDCPWKFSAGTKSRPQHYPRLTFKQCCDLPVKSLLHPEGARVFAWITAPLMNRVDELADAWGLRYSTMFPWLKLWPKEDGMFIYPGSVARGTGFEVQGNCEYILILKYRKPQFNKRRPFPGAYISPRREHSRKPVDLHADIESRFDGPHCEIFARQSRAGWTTCGNETAKFDGVAA